MYQILILVINIVELKVNVINLKEIRQQDVGILALVDLVLVQINYVHKHLQLLLAMLIVKTF